MANFLYKKWKEGIMAGTSTFDLDVNDATDGPFVALTDTAVYTTATEASDTFYNGSPSAGADVESANVGTDQRITSPTVTTGLFDGGDLTYTAVSGATVEALVIYRHNAGADTTWVLVAYIDSSVTGLPVTPNGGNITVTWNASGIFQL